MKDLERAKRIIREAGWTPSESSYNEKRFAYAFSAEREGGTENGAAAFAVQIWRDGRVQVIGRPKRKSA